MIIEAIALLDTLDADLNTFVMRVRDWYGLHFPELFKILLDNCKYLRVLLILKETSNMSEEITSSLLEIVVDRARATRDDNEKVRGIMQAARTSMGQGMAKVDMINIQDFTKRIIRLIEYWQVLQWYLVEKMNRISPNISTLIGHFIGARLISHAGSLINLAKHPASTLQVLGAEKALFRALISKAKTPKYGLIFNSDYIGKTKHRNKGRISRYLANKCSIAARIDAFMEGLTTDAFGKKLRGQVEERLRFYEEGVMPRKNIAVMHETLQLLGSAGNRELLARALLP